ncbi:TPA: hypothetical protein DCE37_15015 [Candidatus Latescibacteria bacterium]|nr:hypothetical protein [Candidatus Latescibacterota bacterium]
MGISSGLSYAFGHYSLVFIVLHPVSGLACHIAACRKHGIDWLTCEPRELYQAFHDAWGRSEVNSTDRNA